MKEIKNEKFTCENKTYDIKLFQEGNMFIIMAFKNGKRVNPYRYMVRESIDYLFMDYHGQKGNEKLIEEVKNDIRGGFTYEGRLRFLKN